MHTISADCGFQLDGEVHFSLCLSIWQEVFLDTAVRQW